MRAAKAVVLCGASGLEGYTFATATSRIGFLLREGNAPFFIDEQRHDGGREQDDRQAI